MFRRVSRCVRVWGMGWRVCPTRGDSARTGRILGRHKNGEYAAVTRGRPAFQRHESRTEGSDTAPHAGTPKKHCVQEGTARIHRRRAPTLRKPFFLLKQPRAGLFRHSHSGPRVVIPPMQKCRKNAKREFLSPPPTGLPPKPREAVSVGRRRCSGVSEFSSAAATETSDMQLVPPTASIAFVWSAAKPLPCQMHWAGHGPTPPSCGQKPTPTFSYDWRKT